MSATIAMVMAMDKNRLVGKDNAMPWFIPGEQVYFKQITMGKPIIMGRKTFDAIGRVLPGRQNIVVTRNREWQFDDVTVVHSLDEAITVANQANTDEIMITGGAALCELAMPRTQRLYLTVIDAEYEGDTWLTSFHREQWKEVARRDVDGVGEVPGYSALILEPL